MAKMNFFLTDITKTNIVEFQHFKTVPFRLTFKCEGTVSDNYIFRHTLFESITCKEHHLVNVLLSLVLGSQHSDLA